MEIYKLANSAIDFASSMAKKKGDKDIAFLNGIMSSLRFFPSNYTS
jgi:hypothetical protein